MDMVGPVEWFLSSLYLSKCRALMEHNQVMDMLPLGPVRLFLREVHT
jgi:hypothetical protein